ncbi:hypothetical protein [Nocardia farcinica]|uniref:hypothetical protein n=1 Tax=Nocardia farcinica TaxID=37329 RepID=UPI001E60060B|nr:hypothetical protein [Nocardia farcinica]
MGIDVRLCRDAFPPGTGQRRNLGVDFVETLTDVARQSRKARDDLVEMEWAAVGGWVEPTLAGC